MPENPPYILDFDNGATVEAILKAARETTNRTAGIQESGENYVKIAGVFIYYGSEEPSDAPDGSLWLT